MVQFGLTSTTLKQHLPIPTLPSWLFQLRWLFHKALFSRSYGTTRCVTACDHPWMDPDLYTSPYLPPLYQFLLDFLKFTARLFLVLTAVPALRLMLLRASVTLLTAIVLPLVLPEYHLYKQQAQHLRVVINQPWWPFSIWSALFLPCLYSSLSVVRPEVQKMCQCQSEGKFKKPELQKRNHTIFHCITSIVLSR